MATEERRFYLGRAGLLTCFHPAISRRKPGRALCCPQPCTPAPPPLRLCPPFSLGLSAPPWPLPFSDFILYVAPISSASFSRESLCVPVSHLPLISVFSLVFLCMFLFLFLSLSVFPVHFFLSLSFSPCLSFPLSFHSFLSASLSACPTPSSSLSRLPPHLPALTVIASKNCSLHEWVPITKAKFVFLMSLSTVFWG